ncbi:unnamed protein product [Lactuca saligna]|uniref:Uncharacterized protein n=1 Tax=Lactuca saligna TaxID=75948 RepID=A0AA36E562_LACSI|nr:unnamed protein product [Lactuca saligna]
MILDFQLLIPSIRLTLLNGLCVSTESNLASQTAAVGNLSFDKTLINRERGIILHKTEEMRAQTEEVIFDHLHSTAFQYTPP